MSVYYTLKVSRAEGVDWDPGIRRVYEADPSLYVEIELDDVIQRTNTVKHLVAPSWEETLPLLCSETTMHMSIELRHKSKIKGRDKIIGRVKIELATLLDNCKNSEAKLLVLPVDGRRNPEPTATIVVHLVTSNVMANAKLALDNLVRDIPQGPLSASTPAEDTVDKSDRLAIAGKKAIRKTDAFKDAIPTINNFVAAIDNIANANSYLRLAWYTVSALYIIVSAQVKADDSFKRLVKMLVKMFAVIKDTEHLGNILQSLESTISELLDVITECCLLMRKHARHSFAGRSLKMGDKVKLEDLEDTLNILSTSLHDGFIRQTAKVAEETAKQIEVFRLFQELGLSSKEETNAFDRPHCLPGTRTSIQKQIIDWATSDSTSNIFWLCGVAGSGKSTVATSIAEHFRGESQLGAYLFFTRDKSKPASVIPDIAFRLAATNTSIATHISAVFAQQKDMSSASASSLFKEFILNPLKDYANEIHDPIIIILDALDECGTPSSRHNLMLLLQTEFTKLPSKIRFLVTSRPEPDIIDALLFQQHVEIVELDYSSYDSRHDVHTYLSNALPKAILKKEPPGWDWDKVINILSDSAEGLFIWASTAVKLVSEATFPFYFLENLVSKANSLSLQELYSTALENALPWDEMTTSIFSKVMALVLFGNMRFSDKTIDGMLGLPTHIESANILSKLQPLIAYESGKPIRLHHASFYDYLTSSDCHGKPWFIDTDSQKQMIAGRCFDVMASSLCFNICSLETSSIRNKDVPDLGDRIKKNIPQHLIYACRFWAQHLREVLFSDILLEKLTIFAYDHLLYWFEVLSLIKNFYHQAGQAFQDSIEWIGDKKPELSSFLRQAIKLASTFAVPITECTPHIYVSMLPLTEQDSEVSAHYALKTPPLSLVTVERKGIKQLSSLIKLFDGHTFRVTSVEFSPDGRRIVSGSHDKTVLVWDIESGKVVAGPFKGHTSGVTCVEFSPDGRYIVSGSHDKTVLVWDIESGKVHACPFEGHTSFVTSARFSPDGKRVVSSSWDKTVLVWDIESGAVVASPFVGHTSGVTSARFSPDGKRVVSGSWDNTVLVWDVESGKVIAGPFVGHTSGVTSVGFSPDGKCVISGSDDNTVLVWDVEIGGVVAGPFERHKDRVTSVGFSPDGKCVVSGSYDNTILVWGVESGEVVAGPFTGHTSRVTSVGFSPDGKYVVSGSWDGTVRVWDVESGEIAAAPLKGHTSFVTSVRFSPDGKLVVSGSYDNTVIVWDVESGNVIAGPFKEHTGEVISVGFSPDGKRVVSGSYDKTVRMWDLESGEVVASPFKGHTSGVISVRFSPDGKRVVSGSYDNTVLVWDVESGKVFAGPFKGQAHGTVSVGFSPDGKRVVSGSSDKTVLVRDVNSGEVVAGPFKGHVKGVTSVGFSPDGRLVISGSNDGIVFVWDVETGRVIAGPFKGPTEGVSSVGFSLNGKRFFSCFWDGTALVWGIESEKSIRIPFDGHVDEVTLSQDETRVVSISEDKYTIRVSNVDGTDDLSTSPEEISNWTMSDDSWISNEGKLLLWIPPDIRHTLCRPRDIAVLNQSFFTRLDFTNYDLRGKWYK